MGLITYNGKLLLAAGGFANSKDCCCGERTCYCFTQTASYAVSARWRKCYRNAYYDPVSGTFVYADGQPCDGGANGMICPPGSVGRFVTLLGGKVQTCGCGSGGTAYQATIVTSTSQWNACTAIGSPP